MTTTTRVLAIVFTDIVGSTAARQQLGDGAYSEAVRAHHGLLRQALAEVGHGEEIETAGDSMLLAFETPSAAVQWMLQTRRALAAFNADRAVPLRDRFAAHLGEVVVHQGERTELFSLTLDTCARVLSLGEADRLLLTRAVFDSARQQVSEPGLTWWHHGHYALQGLEAPVEVCEVAEASDGSRAAPESVAKAQRLSEVEQSVVAGWRPSPGAVVPHTAYLLERTLGEGATGEVWVGRHKVLKDRRVFKFCFGAERLRSLRREVTIFRVLQERVGAHPHIVRLHDVRLDEAPCYLVTDFAEGSDLHGWWASRASDPPSRAERLEVAAQVADGLQAAHDAGVLHRDVKPANLLVEDRGDTLQVRLLDFGIGQVMSAELLAGITQHDLPATMVLGTTSSASGTRMYLAPELLGGAPASPRSDVYALGVVLWQLLVGELARPVPMDWARDIDDELLQEDLRRCFAGDPGERWAGAADLARSLRTVEARRAALAERVATEARRAVEEAQRRDAEQRRSRALQLVAEAEAIGAEVAVARSRAAALQAESEALLAGVAGWEPEARKAPGWAKADEARAARREARLRHLEVEQTLHAALRTLPGLPEAHAALAGRYLEAHERAERERDADGAAEAEQLARTHGHALPEAHAVRQEVAAYLRGDGALTLVTEPAGAEVLLYRYEERNRRLVEAFERRVGTTPLSAVPLPMGSYVCVLRHPERAEVRYPVEVARGGHWEGIRPGDGAPRPVWLPPAEFLGPDEVYVAPGWFRSGGDPEAYNSHEARRLWCDGLVVQRFPVTNRQYIGFLDDLVGRGLEEEALDYVPRERAGREGERGAMLYGRTRGGGFEVVTDADGDAWDLDWPVMHVDWHGARGYLAWRAEVTGRPWRLPGELEWEKAARGVDGRFYPWGDHLDPSWCCMTQSHRDRRLLVGVDTYPVDTSPYGVRGMGGNVRDWCLDTEGRVVDNVVLPPEAGDTAGRSLRVVRGGAWNGVARYCRAAYRFPSQPRSRYSYVGFRGAMGPVPQHD